MDVRAEAAGQLEGLFADGGRRVLRDAGLPRSWVEVLAEVPVRRLQPEATPARTLGRVRDHLAREGRVQPATVLTEALHAHLVEAGGEDSPDALLELGALGALADRAREDERARRLLHQAWSALRAAAPGDLRVAVVAGNYGVHLHRVGDLDDAERKLREAWEIRSRVAPRTTGLVAAQLGEVRLALGRAMDAIPPLRDAWRIQKETLGPDHARTISRARTLARAFAKIRRLDQAVPVLRSLYDGAREAGEPTRQAEAAYELALALRQAGGPHAEETFRLSEECLRLSRGRDQPALPARLSLHAQLLRDRGHPREAEGLLREALEVEKRLYGEASVQVALRYAMLGHHAAAMGRSQEALGLLDVSASMLGSFRGSADPRTRAAAERLIQLLVGQARRAASRSDRKLAIALLHRADDVARSTLGHGHRLTAEVRQTRDELGFRRP